MDNYNTLATPVNTDVSPPEDEAAIFAKSLLTAEAAIFASDGYYGDALYEQLDALNYGCDPRADEAFLRDLVAQYPEKPKPKIIDPVQLAINSGDVRELQNLIATFAQIATDKPLQWGILKGQIKETFGKKVNVNDLQREVSNAQRLAKLKEQGKKPDVTDVARAWASERRDTWAYDESSDVWRYWTGAYWEAKTKKHLLDREVSAALQSAEYDVNTASNVNWFERLAEAECLRDFTTRPGLINFDNGTLDLATGQLRAYERCDNLTYCLNYPYMPGQAHPAIDAFLSEVLPDEYARLALMAHAGLALQRDMLIHHFYGLIGKPRSGKTTILALINRLCGVKDAFSFAGHSVFSRDVEGKRSRYSFVNRLIVGIDEMPQEALQDEEILKAMSSHSAVEMRGMNRDEETSNRWKPKILFTTNDQPRYKDSSSAIKERAIFAEIMTARSKEKRDPRLLDKLSDELGAFAASCLELAAQVLRRGYYPQSAAMKELLDRIANQANPLKQFLQEQCLIDGSESTRELTSLAYDAYKAFCEDNGHKHMMAKNTFSLTLHGMHIGILPRSIKVDGKVKRGLVGMRLRVETDPIVEQLYEDDIALDKPKRLTVVDGRFMTVLETVNHAKPPVEPCETGRLTVLTVLESNLPENETYLPFERIQGNQIDGTSHMREIDRNNRQHRQPIPLKPPVEPCEQVDGLKVGPSTTVNRKRKEM